METQKAFELALELSCAQSYHEARSKLNEILKADPRHVDSLILLGKVEFYLGHASGSRECFEKVLTFDPHNIAAYFGLQYFRERLNKWILSACVFALMTTIILTGLILGSYLEKELRVIQELSAQAAKNQSQDTAALSDDLKAVNEKMAESNDRLYNLMTDEQSERKRLTRATSEISRDIKTLSAKIEALEKENSNTLIIREELIPDVDK